MLLRLGLPLETRPPHADSDCEEPPVVETNLYKRLYVVTDNGVWKEVGPWWFPSRESEKGLGNSLLQQGPGQAVGGIGTGVTGALG